MEGFINDELFTKGVYRWTGGTSLGSYFVSAISGHYDWALKNSKLIRRIVEVLLVKVSMKFRKSSSKFQNSIFS